MVGRRARRQERTKCCYDCVLMSVHGCNQFKGFLPDLLIGKLRWNSHLNVGTDAYKQISKTSIINSVMVITFLVTLEEYNKDKIIVKFSVGAANSKILTLQIMLYNTLTVSKFQHIL